MQTVTAADRLVSCSRYHSGDQTGEERRDRYATRLGAGWGVDFFDETERRPSHSRIWNLPGSVVARSWHPRRSVSRDAAMVRADPADHYSVEIRMEGETRLDADGHRFIAAPGQPFVLDMTRPESAENPEGTSFQYFMPRDVLTRMLGRERDLHGLPLQGPLAAILVDHLAALTDRLDGMTGTEAEPMAAATTQLVAACIAGTPMRSDTSALIVEDAQLREACRLIDARLADPELDIAAIARDMRVSRATLYRLFEAQGGVMRYIRERRLASCRDAILCPGDPRSHAAIAEAFGFKSAAHFSNAYQRHFGHRPSETVESGGSGSRRVATASESLTGWLGSMRAH